MFDVRQSTIGKGFHFLFVAGGTDLLVAGDPRVFPPQNRNSFFDPHTHGEAEPVDFQASVEITRFDPRGGEKTFGTCSGQNPVDPIRVVGMSEEAALDETCSLLVLVGNCDTTEPRRNDCDVCPATNRRRCGSGNNEAGGVNGLRSGAQRTHDAACAGRCSHDNNAILKSRVTLGVERRVTEIEVIGPPPFLLSTQDRLGNRAGSIARLVEGFYEHDSINSAVKEERRRGERTEGVDHDGRSRHIVRTGEE